MRGFLWWAWDLARISRKLAADCWHIVHGGHYWAGAWLVETAMAAAGLCRVDDTGLSNWMVGVTSFAGGAFLWRLHATGLFAQTVGERSVKTEKASHGQLLAR